MDNKQKAPPSLPFNLWVVTSEIGFTIAVPLVILILIGIKVDAALSTTPLFIIISMLVSFALTFVLLHRLIKRYTPAPESKKT